MYDRMLCKIILDLLLSPTYRISMPITEIHVHWNYNSYSVCPRYKATMEREYQSFCDRCGQRLDWSKYENAEVVLLAGMGQLQMKMTNKSVEINSQNILISRCIRRSYTKFGTKLASNAYGAP